MSTSLPVTYVVDAQTSWTPIEEQNENLSSFCTLVSSSSFHFAASDLYFMKPLIITQPITNPLFIYKLCFMTEIIKLQQYF
jgi:hypothetical protein